MRVVVEDSQSAVLCHIDQAEQNGAAFRTDVRRFFGTLGAVEAHPTDPAAQAKAKAAVDALAKPEASSACPS